MTNHVKDEERERLRTKISSQNLLTRLYRNHSSQPIGSSSEPVSCLNEQFAPLHTKVNARLGLAHLKTRGREFKRLKMKGRELLCLVAEFYDVTLDDLRKNRRTGRLTRARMAFYFHARCLQLPNEQIARLMCRDRTTVSQVLYAHDHQITRLTKDQRFRDELELIWLKANEQYGVVDEATE